MDLIAQYLGQQAPVVANKPSASAPSSARSRKSFVTLLTNDNYFYGVSVVCKTLRQHSPGFQITVLAGPAVSETTLARLEPLCTMVLRVEALSCPLAATSTEEATPAATTAAAAEVEGAGGGGKREDHSSSCWAQAEMTKLNIWNLTQFDQVVYVDADCMVLDSIDELFDLDTDFAAAPDIFPPDKFNAGVLVIRPSADVFTALKQQLGVLSSYDGGDTGFLNAYFPLWYQGPSCSRLAFGYNAQRTMYWFTHEKRPGYWESISPLKIVHFSSSPKPWEVSMGGSKGDLEHKWWLAFMS